MKKVTRLLSTTLTRKHRIDLVYLTVTITLDRFKKKHRKNQVEDCFRLSNLYMQLSQSPDQLILNKLEGIDMLKIRSLM